MANKFEERNPRICLLPRYLSGFAEIERERKRERGERVRGGNENLFAESGEVQIERE